MEKKLNINAFLKIGFTEAEAKSQLRDLGELGQLKITNYLNDKIKLSNDSGREVTQEQYEELLKDPAVADECKKLLQETAEIYFAKILNGLTAEQAAEFKKNILI